MKDDGEVDVGETTSPPESPTEDLLDDIFTRSVKTPTKEDTFINPSFNPITPIPKLPADVKTPGSPSGRDYKLLYDELKRSFKNIMYFSR